MRERPILMHARSVRGILEGRKAQTRRIVKPQPIGGHYLQPLWGTSPDGVAFGEPYAWTEAGPDYPDGPEDERRCPYGVPGDRLWVRETWARPGLEPVIYRADEWAAELVEEWRQSPNYPQIKWRPSIFMPRWASRARDHRRAR